MTPSEHSGSATALLSAGLAARSRGEAAAAEKLLGQAIAVDPGLTEARSALASLLIALGRHGEALPLVESALELDPDDATSQHCLGLLFLERALFEPAIAAFERCIRRAPQRTEAWRNLAAAQRSSGRPREARATIERALRQMPEDPGLTASLAGLCEYFGEHARVLEILLPRVTAGGYELEELLTLTSSLRALGQADRARGLLENALRVQPAHEAYRVEFALAQILDDAREYDRAFAHLERANRGKGARFDPDGYRRHVDAVMEAYGQLRAGPPAIPGSGSRRPVFIVGMPRSGTSLIEQILAAHPEVTGGGELADIMLLAQTTPGGRPRPGGTQALDSAELRRLAHAYLSALDRIDRQAARVTDKMWENFEYLGFIERLFPRARVIHCSRDPLDTAVSCYFQHFAANGAAFAYELRHLGVFYREHERLMSFWRRESRLELLDVRYEEVVRDLEGQARRAIDFIGLEWSDACLDFHASGRTVNTASYAQVRKPLYSTSVGRWRHYACHLKPFAEAAGIEMAD